MIVKHLNHALKLFFFFEAVTEMAIFVSEHRVYSTCQRYKYLTSLKMEECV